MIQIELSQILKEFHNYEEQCGQLYVKAQDTLKWFDMLYVSRANKLSLFLYILHKSVYSRKLYIGYEHIHIINDVSASQESEFSALFDLDTFYDIEPLLPSYSITTPRFPDIHPLKRFAIIPLEDFKGYAISSNGLLEYCEYVCEQLSIPAEGLESLSPTEVFIDCPLGTDINEYLSYIHTLSSKKWVYSYVNAGYNSYQKEKILQAPTAVKYNYTTIDGWTTIEDKPLWWIITHIPGESRPFEMLNSLYKYITALNVPNVYISSKGLMRGENKIVRDFITFKPTTDFSIPTVVLYLFALIHVNTGKVFEFIGLQQRYRDTYLEAVAQYASREMCELSDRIKAFSSLSLNSLYLSLNEHSVLPVRLIQKELNLKFRVVSLEDITSRISYTSSGYAITSSSTEQLPFKDWSEEAFSSKSVQYISYIDMLTTLIADDIKTDPKALQSAVESYTYAVLRLLEQKLLQFRSIKTLADIIVFNCEGTTYIGFGRIKPEYKVDIYLCAGEATSLTHVLGRLIPSSVLIEEDPTPELLEQLLAQSSHSYGMAFSDEQTKLQILALSTAKVAGLPFSIKEDISTLGVTDPLKGIVYASLSSHYNYTIRREMWVDLMQHFNSFGLRMLDSTSAPLNIYGGLNIYQFGKATLSIYPVAFDQFPRRAVNEF